MAVPLLMPQREWAYRLVFDAEGNLGSTSEGYQDTSPRCDSGHGCSEEVHHPSPPFLFTTLESRQYWYRCSSFDQFPHVHRFASLPDLLRQLPAIDLGATSAAMT